MTSSVGRFHGFDNLFVSDGGLVPTSGAHDLPLTIMAIAVRDARQ